MREVDPHGIELRDVGQQAVGRIDIRAVLLLRETRQPRDRRGDRRIAEVELRARDVGARLFKRGRCGLLLADGIVEILLAQRVLGRQRLDAIEIGLCGVKPRFLLRVFGARRVERGLERLAVHLEHDVPLMNHRAFFIDALFQKTAYACAYFDLLRAFCLTDIVKYNGHVAQRDIHYIDIGRRGR